MLIALAKSNWKRSGKNSWTGFADAYRVDRSNANAAYIGFLEGCMLDWHEEIYDMLGSYEAGLECGTAYRERMDGQD